MLIKVLGSAAGGGLPQINCNCRNCSDVRNGHPAIRARTQSSLAVSRDGREWALLNASPDLRAQIAATPELWPNLKAGARACPITTVVLTNADVDHIAGLLSLREGIPFALYASSTILEAVNANPIFNVLGSPQVARKILPLEEPVVLAGEIVVEAFAVPGKVALYLEGPEVVTATRTGDTLGLKISDPDRHASFLYIPGCAGVDAELCGRLRSAQLVLFDGTLYADDEMIVQGLSSKTGQRMGHMSMSGPLGSLAAFRSLDVKRRIYVHMNNSNPALREDSPERHEVARAGWEIAWDGMEIRL